MKKYNIIIIIGLLLVFTSCEDFLVQAPVDLIGDEFVIEDDASAEGVVLGMYSSMQTTSAWGDLVIFTPGILSDEMNFTGTFPTKEQFFVNNITAENVTMRGMWSQAYRTILIANTFLERAPDVGGLDPVLVTQLTAEAKFGRAFAHFDLVKFWGDVPLVLVTDKAIVEIIPRTSVATVYAQIITDLTEAEAVLPYNSSEKNRVTKGAAQALLARVYLYTGDMTQAGAWADKVIQNGGYSLEPNYTDVFTQGPGGGSSETIWQLFASSGDQNLLAWYTQPVSFGGRIDYAPSPKTVALLEDDINDTRRNLIVDDPDRPGGFVTIKYTDVATGTDQPNVLRLADMYLIRAEANSSVADINVVRARAGAAPIATYSQSALLDERMRELAFEGHRWFDLIRTGNVNAVMSVTKPISWDATDELLPIPQREIDQNPTLTQNPGY